jgi:type IV pilus assembly protein PilP
VTPVRRVAVLTLTILLAGRVALAQAPQAGAPQAATPPGAPPSSAPAGAAQPAAAEKKPDAIEPQGYTYNPEGRRDPFVTLLRRGTETASTGKRVGGLAGLETAEVNLRGTLISQGAYVGIVQGADNKTYIVRAGDKLADGSVRSITANAMVILQQVNDPLSLQKEHEVRKQLRQTEEGK